MSLLFVYGTLKNGHGRHSALEDCRMLGTARTKPLYSMFAYGGFPAVVDASCPGGQSGVSLNTSVHGELYEVPQEVIIELDRIEGVGHNLFARKLIHLDSVNLLRLPLHNEAYNLFQNQTAEAYLFMQELRGAAEIGGFWPKK